MDDLEQAFYDALLEMDEDEVLDALHALIEAGKDRLSIASVAKTAMDEVGRLFQEKEIFLTELIMAGELLNLAMKELGFDANAPASGEGNYDGKIIIGTVKGDVHDIGKNIVASMLASNNFRVIDIGVDVSPEKFIEAIKKENANIVAMSGLLTLAYDSMKETIDTIKKEGLREKVRIMIGGGSTDQTVCEYVGADAYGADAMDGVLIAQKWVGKN